MHGLRNETQLNKISKFVKVLGKLFVLIIIFLLKIIWCHFLQRQKKEMKGDHGLYGRSHLNFMSFAFEYLSFMSYINLIYIEECNENYISLTILVSKMPQKSYFGTVFSLAT